MRYILDVLEKILNLNLGPHGITTGRGHPGSTKRIGPSLDREKKGFKMLSATLPVFRSAKFLAGQRLRAADCVVILPLERDGFLGLRTRHHDFSLPKAMRAFNVGFSNLNTHSETGSPCSLSVPASRKWRHRGR